MSAEARPSGASLAMIAGGLLLAAAAALARFGAAWPEADPGRPWAWIAVLSLPGLLWAPGLGLAAWLGREAPPSRLQLGLDAAWIGLGLTWIDVSLARELGLRGDDAAWATWGLAAGWAALGLALAWRCPPPTRTPRRELQAAGLVLLAVIGVGIWKARDLSRPLDGHWYLAGADEEGREALPLEPDQGWSRAERVGWGEAGAWRLEPAGAVATLTAPEGARGRIALAVRGPVGSRIRAGGQEATVQASVTELPDEGPVRRYLRAGVAGLLLDVDLGPGERLEVEADGEAVYLLPGTDAVWSLHAAGELRYVHYYQLLNQVENQVWAEELLTDRWVTLNQPPGWSPILALATLWVLPDLQGANALFLGVLLLVGLSSARLTGALVPQAPAAALALPAAMTAAHGLLMIEPGSTNFPDSLYAAALLGVAGALAADRPGWFGGLGAAAALLRYPGAVVPLLLALAWRASQGRWPAAALRSFAIAMSALAAGALLFFVAGHLEDAAFIVYFEIFPEHWHDDYQPSSLLPRAPEFYALWMQYTGGGLLLALAGLVGRSSAARATRFLLGGVGAYSLILCTVDHHPTHYFLPLVGFTAPALAAAAAARRPALGIALPILCLVGVTAFLWRGVV